MNADEYIESLKDDPNPGVRSFFTEPLMMVGRSELIIALKAAFEAGQQNGFPPAGTVYTPSADDENFDQDPG